jgi:uncharacterized membrane protein YfhO
MAIFSKRTLRIIKTLLITPHTEFALLIARVIIFYVLFYQLTLTDVKNNQINLLASDDYHQHYPFKTHYEDVLKENKDPFKSALLTFDEWSPSG